MRRSVWGTQFQIKIGIVQFTFGLVFISFYHCFIALLYSLLLNISHQKLIKHTDDTSAFQFSIAPHQHIKYKCILYGNHVPEKCPTLNSHYSGGLPSPVLCSQDAMPSSCCPLRHQSSYGNRFTVHKLRLFTYMLIDFQTHMNYLKQTFLKETCPFHSENLTRFCSKVYSGSPHENASHGQGPLTRGAISCPVLFQGPKTAAVACSIYIYIMTQQKRQMVEGFFFQI